MVAGETLADRIPGMVKLLKENLDVAVSIDSLNPVEIRAAVEAGVDMESLISETMNKDFGVDESEKLEETLKTSSTVLYLADNVGEIVFDKLLIKKLNEYDVKVTVALKEKPILNDACVPDALSIGLDEVAELASTGTDSIGVIYGDVSVEFKELFNASDMPFQSPSQPSDQEV